MTINGKTYHMWGNLVAQKDQFIGGNLHEEDMGVTADTIITDISLVPNGESSAAIKISGEKFNAWCDVRYLGVGGGSDQDLIRSLTLHSSFGATWTLTPKAMRANT